MGITKKMLFFACAIILCSCSQNENIIDMRCEYRDMPNNVDVSNPRFSWSYGMENPDFVQADFQISISENETGLFSKSENNWTSEKVLSDIPYIEYNGKLPLKSNVRYYWQIEATGKDGKKD
jgi:hypothetical protein